MVLSLDEIIDDLEVERTKTIRILGIFTDKEATEARDNAIDWALSALRQVSVAPSEADKITLAKQHRASAAQQFPAIARLHFGEEADPINWRVSSSPESRVQGILEKAIQNSNVRLERLLTPYIKALKEGKKLSSMQVEIPCRL